MYGCMWQSQTHLLRSPTRARLCRLRVPVVWLRGRAVGRPVQPVACMCAWACELFGEPAQALGCPALAVLSAALLSLLHACARGRARLLAAAGQACAQAISCPVLVVLSASCFNLLCAQEHAGMQIGGPCLLSQLMTPAHGL